MYLSEEKTKKRAKILEYNNGRSLVRLENSPVTVEWPDIPSLEVSRHEAEYQLNKNGTHYSIRVVEVGPQVSYAFFNTFIAKAIIAYGRASARAHSATHVAAPIPLLRSRSSRSGRRCRPGRNA